MLNDEMKMAHTAPQGFVDLPLLDMAKVCVEQLKLDANNPRFVGVSTRSMDEFFTRRKSGY